jgi:hypothetical protein
MTSVVACTKRDPVADGADNTAGLPAVNQEVPSPVGAPPQNAVAAAGDAEPDAVARIPAALQGRWALTPADCTTTRGDAKGLLVVEDKQLRFYESRAVPASGVQADADSISGTFDFTGEGQNWSKYVALELQGRDLVRTETNPTASFTYAKCM